MAITNQSSLQSTITLPDSTTERVTSVSNTTVTENLSEELSRVKESSKTYGLPEEILTQTVTVTNTSSYDITNISLTDTLSEGASFVEGSVKIDGTSYPDLDPMVGFDLPFSIPKTSGETVLTYQIQIDKDVSVDAVTNSATVSYTADSKTFTDTTNSVAIDVIRNQLSVVKTASSNVVQSGDTLTFTTTIRNDGNTDNTDLLFTDTIPLGTSFVSGSVKINGTTYADYNPKASFSLPDLTVGASVSVSFDVLVN